MSEINVVSETITTHEYEAKTLARAFTEITGIKVNHDLIQEGDVVEKLQTSMQSGKSIYDGWISDSDLIGTHYRYGAILPLSDYISGAGKEYTNPGLDLKDFIGTKFTTAPDGKLYQLPDQQFANVYWFRADWFARKDLQDKFKAKYGYELGVPTNWSAYEVIAEFFSNDVKELDGKRVYGHMDYGKKDPSLGWRFTDAWLSIAGATDKGLLNGMPVDEWGHPRGRRQVHAGGRLGGARRNHTARRGLCADQVRGLDEEVRAAAGHRHDLLRIRPGAGAGADCPADLLVHRLYRRHDQKGCRWSTKTVRRSGAAPSPYGPYWKDGMQNGYQDVGSWTFFKSTDTNRLAGAWLYAQFVTSKTVSLKKSITGLTFIRDSDINSEFFTRTRPTTAAWSSSTAARRAWRGRPPATTCPTIPKLAQLWWKNVATRGHGREDAAAGHGHAGQRNGSGCWRGWSAPAWRSARLLNPRAIRPSGCRTSTRHGRSWPTKSPRARPSRMKSCCRPGRGQGALESGGPGKSGSTMSVCPGPTQRAHSRVASMQPPSA